MAFEDIKEDLEKIQEESKELINSNIAYYKLWGFKVAMQSTTMILKFFLIVLFATLFVLFASLAAWWDGIDGMAIQPSECKC